MIAKISAIIFGLALWSTNAHAQDAAIAVDHVAIDYPKCLNAPAAQLQFACHRLEPGKGYALAYRRYWSSKRGDDDAFQKLTIYFSVKPIKGEVFQLTGKNVWLFFSSGPSSFPGKAGCYGRAKSGSVKIDNIGEDGVVLEVNANLDLQSLLGWKNMCKGSNIKGKYKAKLVGFEKLNPWYGVKRKNNDIWDESHPTNP